MRILVVEDDQATREVLAHVLESFGHSVFSVADQESAAQALQTTKPDLILLDLLLNGDVSTPFVQLVRDLMAKPFELDALEELVGGR